MIPLIKKTSLSAMLAIGVMLGAGVATSEIVYDDFGGTPKSYSFGTTAITAETEQSIQLPLPGDAFRFNSFYFSGGRRNIIQYVGPDVYSAVVGSLSFVVSAGADQTWSDVNGGNIQTWANLSSLDTSGSYSAIQLRTNPTYIPFRFADTNDNNIKKYGYVKLSTEVAGSGVASILTLKVYSYAYQTDGTEIAMGAVGSQGGGVSVTAWPTASSITYGAALSAATLSGGAASVAGSFGFTSPAIVPNAGTGNQSVTFRPDNSTLHNAVVGSVPLLVHPKKLTVSAIAASKIYGQADPTFTYNVSGLVGTDTAASVLGGKLSRNVGENVGTYTIIKGTLAANPNYTLSYISANFTIKKAAQTIAFPAIARQSVAAFVALDATASSSLPVAYTVIDGPGTLNGATLSFSAGGTVVVVAAQAGNGSWNAAVSVTNRVSVYALSSPSGPSVGGNSVTITCGDLGSVTNVLVGGMSAAITGQGADSVTVTMPAFGVQGPQNIVLQTSDSGDMTLAGVYTVNPAGMIWAPKRAVNGPYIAAGAQHNLALKADGSVVAWGRKDDGQADLPFENTDFVAVAGGAYYSLGLRADGTIVGWGESNYGQTTVPAPNADFVALAGGLHHSLVLKADGSVVAWGRNDWGQTDVPTANSNFVAVAAGTFHSLGLTADGTIVGWGRNGDGQTNVPEPNSNFVAVAAGDYYSLGLKADGMLVVWGDNYFGQTDVPAGNTDFVAVAGGSNHSLGLKADGSIVGWGSNSFGQTTVPTPNSNFVSVSAGEGHSLGLKADGTIVVWGENRYGEATAPVPNAHFGRFPYGVAPERGWASGGYPVVINGANFCDGTLGDVTSVTLCGAPASLVSVAGSTQIVVNVTAGLPGIGDVVVVSTSHGTTTQSNAFTYFKADQTIDFPAIAIQGFADSVLLAATASSGLPVAYTVVDGPGSLNGSTLAFSAGGTVAVVASQAGDESWNAAVSVTNRISVVPLSASNGPAAGGNSVTITFGGLGSLTNVLVGGVAATITGQRADSVTITMPAFGVEGAQDIVLQSFDSGDMTLAGAYTVNPAGEINNPEFIASGKPHISGGDYHSMALKADGSVAVWGRDHSGLLNVPAPNSDFVAVSAGGAYCLALKSDGTISGWGRSFDRQTAVPAPNSNFVAISAGDIHSLGLKADGSVVGWGTNTLDQLTMPAPNSGFVAIAAGYSGYSLGMKADGRIVAWGRNDYNQTDVPSPNSNFVAMSAGHRHALGLKADGSVVGWGTNTLGQLTMPTPNTNFVAVAAGAVHSMGLKADGSIVAWGDNSGGQLDVPAPNADFVAVAAGSLHSLGLKADGTIVAWGTNTTGQINVPDSDIDFGLFEYGVTPSYGVYTGGYEVVISGTNLCDGTINDIDWVTICGVTGSVVSVSGSTQIVVSAGQAAMIGRGDVRVVSTRFGETVQPNAFTYQRAEQAPLIFEPITPQAYRVKNELSTSGGSGTGAVSYRVISGPGTILDGPKLYVSAGSGTIVIRATKAQDDLFYATSATATVQAIRGAAILTLSDLTHTYDGTPKHATVTTDLSGMPVDLSYNGSATAPTDVGSYIVVATVDLDNWIGSTTGTLTIVAAGYLHQVKRVAGGTFEIAFATVPRGDYMVQYCDVLGGEWRSIYPRLTAAESITYWTDFGQMPHPHPADVPSRFYRVLVYPPLPETVTPGMAQRVWPRSDGTVEITFATIPGTEYMVQYRDSLADKWQNIYPYVIAVDAVTYWTDSGQPLTYPHPADVSSRFYRILAFPEVD